VKEFLKKLWGYISPWHYSDDKSKIGTYNFLIVVLIVFITFYTSYYTVNFFKRVEPIKPSIVQTSPTQFSFFNIPYAILITSNMVPPKISYTNGNLPSEEFFVGEVVGIKYFGIYGIVEDKIISFDGYNYEIRWRNNNHELPKDVFHGWELFRPTPNSIPSSILQN